MTRPQVGEFEVATGVCASLELHATQTLGKLIREVKRELPDLPGQVEEYLREGLEMRNRLVHGFFTSNVRRLMEPKGRLEIEDELKEMATEIRNRDKIVCSLIDKYLRKYGLATEELAMRTDDVWRVLNFETHDDHPPSKH